MSPSSHRCGSGRAGWWAPALAVLVLAGCGDSAPTNALRGAGSLSCAIATDQIFDGGPGKDGIPALTDPVLVPAEHPDAQYLRDEDRVIGVEIGGQAIAVPHNVGWWHEIVNLSVGGRKLAVTYCPLTGSSIAFDRGAVGGAEFGVSGLLFRNNLVMYDRRTEESLWPQMLRRAGCGPAVGTPLELFPVVEMSWRGWRTVHAATRVVSAATGFVRNYRSYPYGDYEELNNRTTLFPMPSIDARRPPKERVLGVPAGGDGGTAFPFGELARAGLVAVAHTDRDGRPIVVFWDGDAEGAAAFYSDPAGERLEFQVRNGRIVDVETGSVWRMDGVAVSGARAGQRLEPVAEAYVAFWFAWASFQPETRIWSANP